MKLRNFAAAAAFALLASGWVSPAAAQGPARAEAPAGYVEREVQFSSADGTAVLGGALSLPASEGPFPAAVFLSVAGPDDRDQTAGDLRGYRDLARHLAALGIASLRFDDRGVGASTGDYFSTSWEEFAEDAGQAYDLLAADAAIDPARIGFLGMSQGGALSAMATQLRPESAFAVLLSAPGLAGRQALRGQLETTMALSGVSGPLADQYRAVFDEFMGIVTDTRSGSTERRQRMMAFLSGPGRSLIPPYGFVPDDNEGIADMLLGDWYASNVSFDPDPVYGTLTVPVLAIGGGRDVVAPPAQHLDGIRSLLNLAPTEDATVIWFEGGNHLLQVSQTGLPTEYRTLAHSMSPEIMAMIADWITFRFASEN